MKLQIEQFLRALTAENSSEHTIRAYRSDLAAFMAFVGEGSDPSILDRKLLRGYVAHVVTQEQARTTVARKLASLKSLLTWLVNNQGLDPALLAVVRKPRIPHELPDIPSEAEMLTLLSGDIAGPFPERNRVIVELLYSTGIRVQELSGINVADISGDTILIRGKGKKERSVLFGEYAQLALDAYLPLRATRLRARKLKTPALLFGMSGAFVERLDVRNISRIVKAVSRAKGLPERHPHAYRHAFATHLLNAGASIVDISRLLGHARLSTTEIYTQVSVGHMLNAYDKAHPHSS